MDCREDSSNSVLVRGLNSVLILQGILNPSNTGNTEHDMEQYNSINPVSNELFCPVTILYIFVLQRPCKVQGAEMISRRRSLRGHSIVMSVCASRLHTSRMPMFRLSYSFPYLVIIGCLQKRDWWILAYSAPSLFVLKLWDPASRPALYKSLCEFYLHSINNRY
jgi:hypothetical protein